MPIANPSSGVDSTEVEVYAVCMNSDITTTTPVLAQSAGFYVPTALQGTDSILVYRENDLVAWGPESDRANVMRLARVYA